MSRAATIYPSLVSFLHLRLTNRISVIPRITLRKSNHLVINFNQSPPPFSLYSISHHSPSSVSLASMRFAPPSPTSLTVQQPSPSTSSSVMLSSMMFAPPSPSAERTPSLLQPFSDPPPPYSPLEFAPPSFPPQGGVKEPSLPTALGLASERGRKLKPKKCSKSSSRSGLRRSLQLGDALAIHQHHLHSRCRYSPSMLVDK